MEGQVREGRTAGLRMLPASQWRAARDRHVARLEPSVRPHLERRREGVPHPVEDFLFTYYSHRPAALLRWHPGFGSALEDGEEYLSWKGYAEVAPGVVTVPAAYVATQRTLLETLRRLLRATMERAPHYGCFGLHEWAMVYRLPQGDVRHAAWPLRLGASGTDEVVESHRITCSHFDAVRFFTDAARPRNSLRPGRDDRADFEQPACLHAGMDLYKHAFRLSPMIASDLVAECFELARDVRVLDMRASPYDLSGLGYTPVAIETAAGKQAYVEEQRGFAERARPLRHRLLEDVERLLGAAAEGTAAEAAP